MEEKKERIGTKSITYMGVEKPETVGEVKVEIYGLKHVIKIAEEMIARLEYALAMADYKKERK